MWLTLHSWVYDGLVIQPEGLRLESCYHRATTVGTADISSCTMDM
jgi:hypothetical protein